MFIQKNTAVEVVDQHELQHQLICVILIAIDLVRLIFCKMILFKNK
ncbi:unnamed protein product [Wuchereria bancrofti]|uniref:Uncharacterized protein n=1 Tax=Wuchereria bancrofti TaxID=6293 RepID=A0A3P7EJ17_WUCBA|nr:unnamed protein product [Wuchereria bancrofti]